MSKVSLFIEHSLVYSNERPVPIEDVLASLQAMKQISKTLLPSALSKLTNSKIVEVDVLVDAFAYGSFKESFWLQLVFSSERSMKRFQKAAREGDLAGMYKELPLGNKPVVKTIVASSVVAALISYGVVKYVGATGTASERALVEANNNTVVMIGAEAYRQDPMAFQAVIAAVAEGRHKQLAEAAAQVLAPAHNEPDAKLEMGQGLEMPNAVVRAMPRDPEFGVNETEQPFRNAKVNIRETNLDSATSGWRARIDGVVDRKVKLTLGDGVTVKDLERRVEVTADVIVHYRKQESSSNFEPVEIVIEKIKTAAPD